MVKLKINNTGFEVPEGLTILQVARDAGFAIPTLCHGEGLPHYTSCMVCMVKNRKTNSFIPSCSALVQDGMDIDISGDDVILLRRKSIELLLSEHRAECEAPCRVVCPAGYNIPLINRYISGGDLESAIRLTLSETGPGEIACVGCRGYCENACRRKKVDLPVSIRNIKLFIAQRSAKDNSSQEIDIQPYKNEANSGQPGKGLKTGKRFSSHIGPLEEAELVEWLKECEESGSRFREITESSDAVSEAGNCMHCDCRAASDCRLRDLADELSVKDPRGKLVSSPAEKKINRQSGLVFENAKCIKCGLCVRLCEKLKDEPALCFMHRGFVSIISEPLTCEFDDILKTTAGEVIDICPTGALSKLK
jgi:ferredoxin